MLTRKRNVWDEGIIDSSLDSPSKGIFEGATGTLQMDQRAEYRFKLMDLEKDNYFAYDVEMPGVLSHWLSLSDR